jgi:Tol biopolymer transport system component
MFTRFGSLSVLQYLLLAWLALAGSTTAQVKLNGPLPRQVLGAAREFQYTPSGTSLLYIADERADDVFELFSVSVDGSSAPVALSGALVVGGDVADVSGQFAEVFASAPDGSWVAFLADATTDGVVELHRAPLDGSAAPTKLSGALVAGGDVTTFLISADGTTLVFLADALLDERYELFRAPADGSAAPVRLNSTLVGGGDVTSFELGLQSERAYFLADGVLDNVPELFSAPLDASLPAVRLNGALVAGRTVVDFRVAADESRVAFRADASADELFELFSAPGDGSAASVRLNPTLVAGGDVTARYKIGATRVVYIADQDIDGQVELYGAPLDGSAVATKLHPNASWAWDFTFTPDGALVAFYGMIGSERGIFRVSASGGTPVRLSDALGRDDTIYFLEVSVDGALCLYERRTTIVDDLLFVVADYSNLHCVSVAGGTPVQLTQHHLDGYFASYPRLTADASHVTYRREAFYQYGVATDGSGSPVLLAFSFRAESSPDGTRLAYLDGFLGSMGRLMTVDLDGGDARFLSGPTLQGAVLGDVEEFAPTPNELHVLYTNSYVGSKFHVVGAGGGSPALDVPFDPVSGTLLPHPGSKSVAFLANAFPEPTPDLIVAPLWGSGSAVRINVPGTEGSAVADGSTLNPRFTPDGASIVFAAEPDGWGSWPSLLFIAPGDGSLPPTRLNGTGADAYLWSTPANNGRAFDVSSDGTRIVYSAASDVTSTRHNLFSVPVDASSSPVQLSNLTLSGTSVYGNWAITPDGARVVYLAEQQVRFRSELYSAPIDGSSPAVKLNSTLVTGGDVGFASEGYGLSAYARITPDGSRVIYWADQTVNDRFDLYSVPTDGSAAPEKVNGALVTGGDIDRFQLSPDGAYVVYAADATTDEVYELFAAASDGLSAPVKLSGTLVAGGDVSRPNFLDRLVWFGSGRVVYAADSLQDEVVELFSAPIDGSAAPVRLNANMTSGGDVQDDILVSADGLTVLYRADQVADEVFELWRVPIDGSATPERVNLPLPPGGDVMSARFLARGNRILYRADQDVDQVFELYSLRLLPRTPRGPTVPPPISGTVTRQL